ncbi:MAG: hypothetical protein V1809_01465 [Planctomycetota bacterium]
MKVTTHKLREIERPSGVPLSAIGYREFAADEDWYHNLISFTSVVYLPGRRTVLCGLTSFDTDILYEWDPASGVFRGFRYPEVSERFEIKIHRSLHVMQYPAHRRAG